METVEVLDLQNLAHKVLAITVSCEGGATQERYEATRAFWKVSPARANEAEYILSVTRGIVKAMYQVNSNGWQASTEHKGRYYFDGNEITDPAIASLYLGKMIERKKGHTNPVQYLYGASSAKNKNEMSTPADAVLICPQKKKKISNSEFSNKDDLTSIIIPDGVTQISSSAFSDCTNLRSVAIPSSVKKIDSHAFAKCTNLETILFSPSSKKVDINIYAFTGCNALNQESKNLIHKLISQLYYLDEYGAVYTLNKKKLVNEPVSSQGLTEYTVLEGVETIAENAFAYSKIEKVNLPSSLLLIESNAFEASALKEIALPQSLKNIETYAFSGCAQLTHIEIPEGITEIGEGTFDNAGLKSVVLPNSLTEIDMCAFSGCPLEEIALPEGLGRIGEKAFVGGKFNTLTLPESLYQIGYDAFAGCENLEDILNFAIEEVDRGAFADCNSLDDALKEELVEMYGKKVFVWSEDEDWDEDEDIDENEDEEEMFTPGGVISPAKENQIGPCEFSGNTTFTSVVIPNTVTIICPFAFAHCTSLHSVVIPDSVTAIHRNAFKGCTSLKSIVIPHSVSLLGSTIFSKCTSLENISFTPSSKTLEISVDAFSDCDSLSQESKDAMLKILSLSYHIDDSGMAYSLDKKTLVDARLVAKDVTDFTVPEGVECIGERAFLQSHIEKVTIPYSVTNISMGAFAYSRIKEIALPKSIKEIGEGAFSNCASLEFVDFDPDSPVPTGKEAFEDCKSLNADCKARLKEKLEGDDIFD